MNKAKTVLLSRVLLPPISGGRPAGGINAKTEGVPSLGGENIKPNGGMKYDDIRIIPEAFYDQMPKGKLQPLDVLINKDGAQTGKVGLYDGAFDKAAVNEHLFILRAQDPTGLEQIYLFYCLLLPETQQKIYRRITGSAQPGLNSQFVRAVDIPIYKLPVQQKIARILQTIDRAIEKTEALIEKYEQIKAGLMHDLFTRGIGPDGQLRLPCEQAPELYQETPIGWIPKEWGVKEIQDVATVRYGINAAIDQNLEEGIPTITLPCVSPEGDLSLDEKLMAVTARRQVTEDLILREGDLLFNWRNGSSSHLGKTAIFKGGGTVTHVGFLLRIRPHEDQVIPHYLWEQIRFHKLNGVFLRAKQQVNNTFNSEELRRLLVAVPSIEEQDRICAGLSRLGERVLAESKLLNNLKKRKQGLMHDLLTGKVPVQVEEPKTDPEAAHV